MLKMKSMFERKKILPLVLTLANSILNKLGFVELINRTVAWDPDHWEVTPGDLAKIMVLSTFLDIRTPLTHLEDRFEGIDLDFFISCQSKSSYVNSFNAGRALERIGNSNYGMIYETLALSAIRQANIPTERLHADTTTISFYGEYDVDLSVLDEAEREECIAIERGYNKDGRPQCNQVVVGQIVNEAGIPISSRTMSGSTADTDWNAKAVSYLKQLQEQGFQYGIFVADSKLVTHELVSAMNEEENPVSFVSRCPANFEGKLEERMILKAYETAAWKEMGSVSEGKKAAVYRGISFCEEICGKRMRLVVLESSMLKEKAREALRKERECLEPEVKALEKKKFLCEADVEEELKRFHKGKGMKRYECVCRTVKEVKERWPRGRRGAETKPKREESYHIQVMEIRLKEKESEEYLKRESCIVLISNAPETYSDRELLETYKGQQVVENSFRELKSPSVASVIYLKNPKRIEGLSMLLTFSLLVRAIIQYRLREGLREYQEKNPEEELRVGWGNRPLKNPTYKLLYEHGSNCYFEKEGLREYSFAWPSIETRDRMTVLLGLLGVTLEELVK